MQGGRRPCQEQISRQIASSSRGAFFVFFLFFPPRVPPLSPTLTLALTSILPSGGWVEIIILGSVFVASFLKMQPAFWGALGENLVPFVERNDLAGLRLDAVKPRAQAEAQITRVLRPPPLGPFCNWARAVDSSVPTHCSPPARAVIRSATEIGGPSRSIKLVPVQPGATTLRSGLRWWVGPLLKLADGR